MTPRPPRNQFIGLKLPRDKLCVSGLRIQFTFFLGDLGVVAV
jgi:hypothetical protein